MKLNRNTSNSLLKLSSLGYREHRDKFGGQQYQPKKKPYMRYREIEVVEEILYNLQPTSCLEWGAGSSTLFFPPKLSPKARWVSIEHQLAWVERIQNLQPSSIVSIHHIPANQLPWTDEMQDGAYADLADYIEYPEQFSPYDFILVDGRARNHCIQKAFGLIKPEGVVVLHDANRKSYHASFERYSNQVLFRGYRPHAGGIWIGSRGISISEVLDVERHQAVWRLCRIVGKVFRC